MSVAASSGTPSPSTTRPSLSNKSNVFHDDEYPDCIGPIEHRYRIGDGICDDNDFDSANTTEWNWNVPICGFDGGDCIPEVDLEREYPDCIPQLIKLGYGSERICDGKDGKLGSESRTGSGCYARNGRCDESVFAIEACGYEFGECPEHERKYAGCNAPPKWIGDGTCQSLAYTRECQWDGGDCGGSKRDRRANIELCIFIGVVAMILLGIICSVNRRLRRYERSRQLYQGHPPPRRLRFHLPSKMDQKQDLEARRKLILKRIIQRKVLSLDDSTVYTFDVNRACSSDHTAESLMVVLADISSDEVDALSQCSVQSTTNSQDSRSTLDIDEEAYDGGSGNENGNQDHEPAIEVMQPNLGLVDETEDGHTKTKATTITTPTTTMSLPSTCPICVEDYVKGDIIAWSRNEKCAHAFHFDCVIPWLMNHEECPMCRSAYLVESDETPPTSEEERA